MEASQRGGRPGGGAKVALTAGADSTDGAAVESRHARRRLRPGGNPVSCLPSNIRLRLHRPGQTGTLDRCFGGPNTLKSIVILISGRGSNLGAILRAGLPARVAAVISNRADAAGLTLAREAAIPTAVLDHRGFATREQFDAALAELIDRHGPDLVVLAGFMRVLSDGFVERYRGRLLNIHPSLLPAFRGLSTHSRALAAGVRIHGCTVHFVTSELDGGPIIAQAAVGVLADDDETTLAARVLAQEHRIYPQVIRWALEGRLTLDAQGHAKLRDVHGPSSALIAPPLDADGN